MDIGGPRAELGLSPIHIGNTLTCTVENRTDAASADDVDDLSCWCRFSFFSSSQPTTSSTFSSLLYVNDRDAESEDDEDEDDDDNDNECSVVSPTDVEEVAGGTGNSFEFARSFP